MIGLSVVIPTFRHVSTLRELLGSLERQTTDFAFEVIVVANLPEVGLRKIVESYGPRFRFHETGRLGVNIARNKGLDLARGSLVLFLDDDTYLTDREFVAKHAAAHARHPQAIAIGGTYTPKASMTTAESVYHWILTHRFASSRLERDEARSLAAGNVSLKRELLEPRHRFDDRVRFGASEESFFAKLRGEQNLFLIFESLAVEHRARVGLLALARKGFYQGYGRKLAALDSNSLLERPHWNSQRPLEETFRAAHVEETRLFTLALGLYRRAFAYGARLAARDASRATPWPEFSPAKLAAILFSARWGARASEATAVPIAAARAAIALPGPTAR